MALQEALLEEEKHSGVSYWIGSKIPRVCPQQQDLAHHLLGALFAAQQLPVPAHCRLSCFRLWLRQSC